MTLDLDFIVAGGESTRHKFYRFGRPLGRPPDTSSAGAASVDLLSVVVAALEKQHGRMVGAVRTNLLRDGVVPARAAHYNLNVLAPDEWERTAVTRWTLAPGAEIRNRPTVAFRLAWTLYDFHLRERIATDYLDCPDDELEFFTSLGYRRVREVIHPDRGPMNLMRLDIYDWSYLAEIQSPFLSFARGAVSS